MVLARQGVLIYEVYVEDAPREQIACLAIRAKARQFEHVRAITRYECFPGWMVRFELRLLNHVPITEVIDGIDRLVKQWAADSGVTLAG